MPLFSLLFLYTHRVRIVVGKAVYMRKLTWHSLNSSGKIGVKTCVDTLCTRDLVFFVNGKLLEKDSAELNEKV